MSLKPNQIITLYISENVQSTDNEKLGENVESYFVTETYPMYASILDVRKLVGAYIQDIPDSVICQLIYQYSLDAEFLAQCCRDAKWEKWAAHWVAYKAALVALLNSDQFINAGEGKIFKQLGDFSVSRGGGGGSTDAGIGKLAKWLECEIYKYEHAVRHCAPPLVDCLGLTDVDASLRDYTPLAAQLVDKGVGDPNKFVQGRRWLVDYQGDTSGNLKTFHRGRKYGINRNAGGNGRGDY